MASRTPKSCPYRRDITVFVAMGHGVSVDSRASDSLPLGDLIGLGKSPSGRTPKHCFSLPRHFVKAWQFEKVVKTVVDSPMTLCDESCYFNVDVRPSCSYLILHVHAPQASILAESDLLGNTARSASESLSIIHAFASRAASILTPRGLSLEVASQTEASCEWRPAGFGSDSLTSPNDCTSCPSLQCSIFVWNGRGVDPHVKAIALTKAFELERLLKLGLLRRGGFLKALANAVSLQVPESTISDNVSESVAEKAAAKVRGNQLLAALVSSSSSPKGASKFLPPSPPFGIPSTTEALGGGSEVPRFPRLGVSLSRSLGAAVAHSSAALAADASGQECIIPSVNTTKARHLDLAKSHSPAEASGGSVAGHGDAPVELSVQIARGVVTANKPRVGPLVPKLALSGLSSSSYGGPCSEAILAAGVAEVDVHNSVRCESASDSGGRKRSRTEPEDDSRKIHSARLGSASAMCGSRGLAASDDGAPKSARTCTQSSPHMKVKAPSLDLAAVSRRSCRAKEDVQMSDEELMRTFDPFNEENNYHLPQRLCRNLQLNHYKNACSEIIEKSLYLSSYVVASDLDCLNKHGITHVVNTAADVCDSNFPSKFKYLTYYLKDSNSEDISLFFYRTLEWIDEALSSGGRVLVHCQMGVSRSSTIVMAYLMWRFGISFEQAFNRVRETRPICNPNTGFTCKLLILAQKLDSTAHDNSLDNEVGRPQLFRVAPYHPKEPFLYLLPLDVSAESWPIFDSRFGWVVQNGARFVLWLGSHVPDTNSVQAAVQQHLRWLKIFERCSCSLATTREGAEAPEFWQALAPFGPADPRDLVARRSCLDAEFELLRLANSYQFLSEVNDRALS